jgi:hypothetical protein
LLRKDSLVFRKIKKIIDLASSLTAPYSRGGKLAFCPRYRLKVG